MKANRRALRIGAIGVGVLLVVLIIIPFFVDVNAFRPKLESELSTALGRQVKVGNLGLSLLSGAVTADDISISDDPAFSKDAFVTAKSLKVGVEVMPLIFSKTLHITGITLKKPQITLLQGPGGRWNFSSIGGNAASSHAAKPEQSSTGALSVDKLKVDDGSVVVGTANSAQKPHTYDKVDIEVTNFSATAQFPFTLSAEAPGSGDIKLKGKCGPINAGNTSETPVDASLHIRNLDLAASGFVQPSTGTQGMANLDADLNSNGHQAKIGGTLTAQKLKLAAKGSPSPLPVEVKYAVDYNLKSQSGTLTQGDVSIGKAVAHLTGTYETQGPTTSVNLKANADNMPVDELEAALPAVGVVLPSGSKLQGGSVSANLGVVGPADRLVITGPIRLSNSKLAGFDLGSKLSAISALSGKQTGGKDTTIQNLSSTVHVAPEGTQANDINLNIPALGVVTGAGTVSPAGTLNFKMHADLSGGAAGGMVQMAGLGGQKGGVPFAIQGTTSDPKFVPDVAGIAGGVIGQALSGKTGAGTSSDPVSALTGLLGKKKK
jgi:AsmA protein